MTDANATPKIGASYGPSGVRDPFKNDKEFIEFVVKARSDGLSFDQENRNRGVDDTRHGAGFQWDTADFNFRSENNVPALTFNLNPTLLKHRLASRSRKRIGPRVLPESPGERFDAIAKIREGLIRNIERNSHIQRVDGVVSQNQLISGIGHYEVAIEYADADVFDVDIRIKTDTNPWCVIYDPLATDPTAADAEWVIKETSMSHQEFKRAFPKADMSSIGEDPADNTNLSLRSRSSSEGAFTDWADAQSVRVAIVWTMHAREKTLVMLTNGDVVELPEGENPETFEVPAGPDQMPHVVLQDPSTGRLMVRTAMVKYARGVITNGKEVLSDPVELPIDRIPIVRVPGLVFQIADKMHRFGILSFAKDAQRFLNYVKSDRIERIVYRNRAHASAQEDDLTAEQKEMWRNAHKARGAILFHRGQKPVPIEPPQVDQAAIIESQAAEQMIYQILDIKPGIVGMEGSTPHSGVALEHQLNIQDSGAQIYDDHFIDAKREVYRIVNQLLGTVYDTVRVTKVVQDDGTLEDAILNDPDNPESADLSIGKYGVDANVGPSQETQRVQAISFIETLTNSNPEIMGVVAPELIELLNIPGTEKIREQLLKMRGDGQEQQSPEMVAMQERLAQMEFQLAELEVAKKEAEVASKAADVDVKRATADSERAQAEERRAKAIQNEQVTEARQLEMFRRMELLIAQTDKVLAEISKIQATPPQNTQL